MTQERRTVLCQGDRVYLVEEDEVRARDLREGTVTVERVEDGSRLVIRPEDLMYPRVEGLCEPEDALLYELRPLVEELLDLQFEERFIHDIIWSVSRHRLLRQKVGKGDA